MNALVISAIVFGCVFGGALFGMFLRIFMPAHHLSANSKDVIKVSMAMVATLAALVVGLLIASAKSSFDSKDSEMRRMVASTILLDRTLAEYGTGTSEIRDMARQLLATRILQIWPDEGVGKVDLAAIGRGLAFEGIQRRILRSFPRDRCPALVKIDRAADHQRDGGNTMVGNPTAWHLHSMAILGDPGFLARIYFCQLRRLCAAQHHRNHSIVHLRIIGNRSALSDSRNGSTLYGPHQNLQRSGPRGFEPSRPGVRAT